MLAYGWMVSLTEEEPYHLMIYQETEPLPSSPTVRLIVGSRSKLILFEAYFAFSPITSRLTSSLVREIPKAVLCIDSPVSRRKLVAGSAPGGPCVCLKWGTVFELIAGAYAPD